MVEVVSIVSVFAWLALAGWSCRIISEDAPRDTLVVAFLFCLFLAPFTAAATLADKRIRASKENKDAG